ncbi:hypothetical protein OJF2_45670 [Aquisphaera giovannonii]|uniref:Planctomycete cytochrome C n=2 Tax=Aquisphaera giovannonii TaxID=406548 RepID=A0A5B9W7A0_9BACT|nr:hypothetical protein OJF2_45670 [Aquisphaera giovannonii]
MGVAGKPTMMPVRGPFTGLLLVLVALLGGEASADDPGHWAFTPPRRPPVPVVRSTARVRNPIDAFVVKKLEEAGLEPAPEADRATLVRRLSFDLTGLPPSLELQDRYLNDPAPDAYERLVDRLLASPQYGERWAQHWLDLARYADTDGFEFDQARPDAWRYRDWVVNALNRDMPYDRFLRLQTAGDEVAPGDPDAFIATGFNRCYPDMVDLNDQGLRRQNALNDITETTGLVFLGLTIGCARCHDHKSDPISQADFYRLQAFFSPARFRDDYPIASPSARAGHEARVKAWEEATADAQAAILRLEAPVRAALAPGDPPGLTDEAAAAIRKPEAERSPAEVRLAYEAVTKDGRIKPEVLAAALGPVRVASRRALLAELGRLKAAAPPPLPKARGLDEAGPDAPPTFFLRRGEFSAKGDEVHPGFPEALRSAADASPAIVPMPRSTGRRKALAEWLTRADHPLTGRVLVNRLWQHHFGRGLVATPSDFGTMGEEPSHPELLDWLACELVARGWSLKAMHRLMVTSATYRQSSRASAAALAADPDNTLLWRHGRLRLDGEAIRDALLAVSGRLNPALGGPPVFPELPDELTKLSNKGAVWPVSDRRLDRDRRSLYVFIRRNLRYPFFEAFDRPDTNASCPRRPTTTIAPQALTLLNSRLANDAAHALAARIASTAGADRDAQVELAYRITVSREPDADERRTARSFLAHGGTFRHFCLALLNANEFLYVE